MYVSIEESVVEKGRWQLREQQGSVSRVYRHLSSKAVAEHDGVFPTDPATFSLSVCCNFLVLDVSF